MDFVALGAVLTIKTINLTYAYPIRMFLTPKHIHFTSYAWQSTSVLAYIAYTKLLYCHLDNFNSTLLTTYFALQTFSVIFVVLMP